MQTQLSGGSWGGVFMNKEEYDKALYLAHHGIKGQKWGVRRYQNEDGSLTDLGKKKYLNSDGSMKPNKRINAVDYYNRSTLDRVGRRTLPEGQKYKLNSNQRRLMDEDGNLTLEGARKTLPIGTDLSKYRKEAGKEMDDRSASWKKYWESKDPKDYEDFKVKNEVLQKKISEVDVERGRQWILENLKSPEIKPLKTDSSVTKKVKKDWNELSDDEFKSKYSSSKETYAKRVEKYGDPYMNAPLAKIGKFLTKHANARDQKKIDALDRDIKSFDQIKNGLKDKNGKTILSKEDVRGSVQGLEDLKKKYKQRIQNRR